MKRPDFEYQSECGYWVCLDCGTPWYPMELATEPSGDYECPDCMGAVRKGKTMKQDTVDFLSTLLWLADNPDAETRELAGKSVHDFGDAFIEGAESFVGAFREHLNRLGFKAWGKMERSFGGNVYLSLSGHGAGFFDDSYEEVAALHDVIKNWAGDHRFEDLDIMVMADGRIDIAVIPEAIEERRTALFKPGV